MQPPPRYFTVDEVNRLVPELERLLTELREVYRQAVSVGRELGLTVRQPTNTNGYHQNQEDRAETLQGQEDQMVARFRALVQEVTDLGAEIKAPETGLVDFRTLRDGHEVYLCWRLGKPECAWRHDRESGFRGRQPLG